MIEMSCLWLKSSSILYVYMQASFKTVKYFPYRGFLTKISSVWSQPKTKPDAHVFWVIADFGFQFNKQQLCKWKCTVNVLYSGTYVAAKHSRSRVQQKLAHSSTQVSFYLMQHRISKARISNSSRVHTRCCKRSQTILLLPLSILNR